MFHQLRSASRASRLGAGLLLALLLSIAALAFLTFQSVRSETIAQKHLVEEAHRQIAAIVSAQIDSRIAELDDELVRELSDQDGERSLIERLRRAEAARAWLGPAVLLRPDGTVFYPRQGAAASGGASLSLESPTGGNSEFERRYALAEIAELRDGEIERAVTLYTTALESAVANEEEVWALNGLARVELKAGRFDRALEAYERLISTASSTLQPSQANLALVAHYQRVVSFEGLENPGAASQAAVDLLDYLLEQRFIVDFDLYTLYRRKVEPKLSSMSLTDEQTRRIKGLREREQQLDATARDLEEFRRTLQQLPLRALANKSSTGVVQTLEILGVDDRIVSLAMLGSAAQPAAASGTSLDDSAGVEGRKMLLAHEWTAEDVAVIISDLVTKPGSSTTAGIAFVAPSGDPYYSSTELLSLDLAAVSAPLATLPGWLVAAFPATGSIDGLATQAVRRHVLLLGLVSLTVVASLLLAAWGISRELVLSRLRSEFVSSVSHEFRTPLALVQMFAESLEEGWIDKSERAATYQKIRRETERLTGLINNVLDFSKIERGTQQYKFEQVDLRELIADAIERYQPQFMAVGVTLEKEFPSLPIMANIDREAMSGVLLNFLSNAMKYIGDGEKKVCISLFTQGERGGFSVSDSGIGMAPAEIERIYDRYYRADSKQVRSVAGSGIGLTVVRSVVEAHGGSISVRSAPSEGSTFTVMLPLVQESVQ